MRRKAAPNSLTMKSRRRWRGFYFLLGVLLAYVAACFSLANKLLSPVTEIAPKPPRFLEEDLPGGTPVWFAGEPRKAPVVFVFVHGFRATRAHWRQAMEDMAKSGFAAVAPDLPGHGKSPDRVCTFGVKESLTVLSVAHWVRAKAPDAKIVLVGASMGGAACWMAVQQEPNCADAVVTESAYAHLDDAVGSWFDRSVPGVGRFLLAPVAWIAESKLGLKIRDVNPIEGARSWAGKPCLVIHDGDDLTIPLRQGELLAEATKTPLWTIPGVAHVEGYARARDEYRSRLLGIAAELLKPASRAGSRQP